MSLEGLRNTDATVNSTHMFNMFKHDAAVRPRFKKENRKQYVRIERQGRKDGKSKGDTNAVFQ